MISGSKQRPIVSQPELLKDSFLPSQLLRREKQVAEINAALLPFMKKARPSHIWIVGPPGAGKSLLARHTLHHMNEAHKASILHINCWENSSLHAIMDRVVRDLHILGAEKISTVFKIECFIKYLENKFMVLALDEIDQLMPKDRNLILYNLCDINRLSLVCISTDRNCYFMLDDRIRSRLNPKLIELPCYTNEDLAHILKQRAEEALVPETWDESIINKISLLSRGDARVALRTLWNAAVFAENENCLEIKHAHLDKAWVSAKTIKKSVVLSALTIHHRLIHKLIAETSGQGILSGPLWRMYLARCKRKKIQPIASRTFSLYLKQLTHKGLIKWERATVKGNVRLLKTIESGQSTVHDFFR